MCRIKNDVEAANEKLATSVKRFLDARDSGQTYYGSLLCKLTQLKSQAYATMNEAAAICSDDLAYFRGYLVKELGVKAQSPITISTANFQSDERLRDWLAELNFGTGHQKLQAQKRLTDIRLHLSEYVANDRERRRAARMYRLSLRWISSLQNAPREALPDT